MENPEQITYFAETDSRNRRVAFGIKAVDRSKHMYVIGKTGMGKSTLLENLAVQDVRNGNGFAFLDPHGSAIDTILKYVPKERIEDVIYFAPFDIDFPIAFNVMEDVGFDKRHLVVSGLMSTFKKIWQDAWSARMEYILGNTLLALLEYPGSTLLEVNKMYSDKAFRQKVVDNVSDVAVKSFWVDEFAKYTDRFALEATPAIQNKIGQFTANPLIRNIIGQPKSSFDFREVMDDKKIVLVNLSKGRIGESNANLLGSMLITKLYVAALSRADKEKDEIEKLPNFYLYVDEFQSFANDSFADILSEARKYKLNLTIAHQYIEQMSDEVRAAVFGNVGSLIAFRVGSYDSEVLEKEFAPVFESQDIVNLGMFQIYLRLMIDGIGSHPFSARTLPPLKKPDISFVEEIVGSSRRRNCKTRQEVEEAIKKIHLGNSDDSADSAKFKKSNSENNHEDSAENSSHKKRTVISKKTSGELRKALLEKEKEREAGQIQAVEVENLTSADNSEISLSELSLNTQRTNSTGRAKKNTQMPKKEKSDLKGALADLLGDLENNKEKKSRGSEKQPNGETKFFAKEIKESLSVGEIPEEELRKMLDVK